MTESEPGVESESVRLVQEITPGFSATHPDRIFDAQLDAFFKDGTFPKPGERELEEMQSKRSSRRIDTLRRLEINQEGRRFCTELRDAIRTHFAIGYGQRILLDAMKFMIRVHIDDKDRLDSGLPGVSHQLKVAKSVLDVLASHGPLDRYAATILAAAMFHDVVEDHETLLLLERDKLEALYLLKGSDGDPALSEDDSAKEKVITLLEYESGATHTIDKRPVVAPNRFIGQILRLVTLDRVALFEEWDGLSHEEAIEAANKLKAKRHEISPEEYAANEMKKRKHYELYTLDTFTDPRRAGEAASLIKIMDLRDNALTIGRIRTRCERLEHMPDDESKKYAVEMRKKYEDLKEKYKGVLVDLYTALPGWPRETWVGRIADSVRGEIGKVLREEYGISVQ